jgi:hypothetical protein
MLLFFNWNHIQGSEETSVRNEAEDMRHICQRLARMVDSRGCFSLIMWKPDIILPPVNFGFCSQWLPPLSNKIWHCEVLEALLASAEKFRFTKAWGLKSVAISIKHADVGGCSNTTRSIRAFVRQTSWLIDLKVQSEAQGWSHPSASIIIFESWFLRLSLAEC